MVGKINTGEVLLNKTRRDILKNWKQFLSIILIAALAVCLFSGLLANYKVFKNRVDVLYESGNIADIWVYVSTYNADDATNLKAMADVEKVEERTVLSGFFASSNAISGLVVGNNNTISKYAEIKSGNTGFMLEEAFARTNKYKVGDTFSFTLPINSAYGLGSNIELKYTITGIMTHPECVSNGSYSSSYFYTDYLTMKSGFNAIIPSIIVDTILSPNQITMQTKNSGEIFSIIANVNTYYSNKENSNLIGVYSVDTLSTNSGVMSDITQSKQIIYVFPVIFFLVAILVILTTISQIIIREKCR